LGEGEAALPGDGEVAALGEIVFSLTLFPEEVVACLKNALPATVLIACLTSRTVREPAFLGDKMTRDIATSV
jgi:hypothetical protein